MTRSHLTNRGRSRGWSIFGVGKARRGSISAVICDREATQPKPESGATPGARALLGRLAALLTPCRPLRVCASLAPCHPSQIALARPAPICEMVSDVEARNNDEIRIPNRSLCPLIRSFGLVSSFLIRLPRRSPAKAGASSFFSHHLKE
jgi:hypothetical protein